MCVRVMEKKALLHVGMTLLVYMMQGSRRTKWSDVTSCKYWLIQLQSYGRVNWDRLIEAYSLGAVWEENLFPSRFYVSWYFCCLLSQITADNEHRFLIALTFVFVVLSLYWTCCLQKWSLNFGWVICPERNVCGFHESRRQNSEIIPYKKHDCFLPHSYPITAFQQIRVCSLNYW